MHARGIGERAWGSLCSVGAPGGGERGMGWVGGGVGVEGGRGRGKMGDGAAVSCVGGRVSD